MQSLRKAVASVREVLAGIADDGPGCAIGVVEAGDTLFAGGRGLASLEYAVPITPASRFYLASVSKQVTALATLLAAESGALDLNGSVRRIISELPAHMDNVTVRHLLTHTGGVRDYFSLGFLSGRSAEQVYSDGDVLELVGRQRALNFAPGSEGLYSNSGYVLLSIAIARATGKRLDAFAREMIFAPLGMEASRFQHDHTAVVPDKAFGYEKRDGQWHVANCMLDVVGDGGMYSSLEDMLAWAKNLLAPSIGPDAIAVMQTPGQLTSGVSTGYGMGLVIGAHRGLAILEHGGGHAGYRTHLLAYPSENFAVVALCNDAAAWPAQLVRRVAEGCLADRMTPAPEFGPMPTRQALQAHSGVYRTANNDVLSLTEQDGALYVHGLPLALRPMSPDMFTLGDPDELRLDFGGLPDNGFNLKQGSGPARRYLRCDPPAATDEGAFLGEFQSPEIGAPCRLARTEVGLTVSFARQPPAALLAIVPDCLWAPNLGATLSFQRDGGGVVSGFRVDDGRARGIVFSRAGEP
jgi:CubicO group peptidase (beta-lactamase class C family)